MRVLFIFTLLFSIWASTLVLGEEESQENRTPAPISVQVKGEGEGTSLDTELQELVERIKNSYAHVSEDGVVPEPGDKPVWTEKHNAVFNEIVKNCGPTGNGRSVSNCESIGFGLGLVDDSNGSKPAPGFQTNQEIKFDEFNGPSTYMHMDLTVSAVGTSKVLDKLIEYNLNLLDGENEKAAAVFTQDPELKLQVEDAAKQPDRYTGIIGRTAGADQLVNPPYNGNLGEFLEDQYYMGDRQKKALIATLNYIQYLTEKEDPDPTGLYTNKIMGSDGRILSSEIEDRLKEGGELYLPSDGTIEAVVEQIDALDGELVDLNSDDPFAGLREFLEKTDSLKENPDVQSLVEEKTLEHLIAMKSKDDMGFDKYGVRLINQDGISSICKKAGEKSFNIPMGDNEVCKENYFEGLKQSNPEYEEDEKFIDPSSGRFSEDLMLQKISEERDALKEKLAEENQDSIGYITGKEGLEAVEKLLNVLSRDSAIEEFAQIDIRNNPSIFSNSTALMGSKGVVKPSDSQKSDLIAKGESEYGPGSAGSGVSFAISSLFDTPGAQNPSSRNPSSFSSNQSQTPVESAKVREEINSILGSSNFEVKDTTVGDSSDGDPFGDAFAFSSGSGASADDEENGGVGYRNQDENDRGNLLKFPEALIEPDVLDDEGNPRMNQAVGIFCNPYNFVLKDDPKCRCLHGPKIKIFYDEEDNLNCPDTSYVF